MKKLIAGVVAVAVLAVVMFGAWWWFELRWRPKPITKHQAEIAKLLEGSGWVSPGLTGPKLYVVTFRNCADCVRFTQEEFPALHKAGVDTRVILIARGEHNGVMESSPAERATVAELWLNRSWPLLERWYGAPPEAWTGQGIPPADGDMARTAVVEAGRGVAEKLNPLLKDNGIGFTYPTLIWWTKDGTMMGCACEKRETYRFVRKDLGAKK